MHEGVEKARQLAKYSSYFHNGKITNILRFGGHINVLLSSSKINPIIMPDNISLSLDNTIEGRLHFEKLQAFNIDGKPCADIFEMAYDLGKIVSLELEEGRCCLQVIWENNPPKPQVEILANIEIKANYICWIGSSERY